MAVVGDKREIMHIYEFTSALSLRFKCRSSDHIFDFMYIYIEIKI